MDAIALPRNRFALYADKPASYNDHHHHRDDRDDLNDLDDLEKHSGAVNLRARAETMGTGMGNRAFDTRRAPRATCEAPADFPPGRKHPPRKRGAFGLRVRLGGSPLSLSKWLTSRFARSTYKDADGTTWDLDQTRAHNTANEIEDTVNQTPDDISGTPNWLDPSYNAAGNMTTSPWPGYETTAEAKQWYAYDAWNRLVKVIYGVVPVNLLAEYEYDGLHRRIRKTLAVPNPTIGRVETWRGGGGIGEWPLAGGFRLDAGASVRSIAPSPRPAHRTGRAVFPHPALGQDFMRSHADSYAEAKEVAPDRDARSGTGHGIANTRR